MTSQREQDDERIEVENELINPDLDPSSTKKKKAPNYTEPEDYELCRAWIRISEDPAVGTHQDGHTFWQRVTTAYHEAIPTPIRPVDSTKKQWGILQRWINKFHGCVHQAELLNQSGQSAKDHLNRALRLYPHDLQMHFKHLRCYNMLVKSSTAPDESTPVPSDAVSDFEGTPEDVSTLERPMGKKKAKMAQQLAMKDSAWKENVAQAHVDIASQSKRNNDILDTDSQSLKEIAENGKVAAQLAIMNQDLEGLDDEQREYFKLKRAQILSSLRQS
ncbi:uncharacterized protein PGTG_21089 [Puccinia graminis f. sp. tritici CRL 75-36-700-3]|uniref:No apical meristem-associated C-terminal domain-containing protein n=1 Tax=Puccinia graminis f. sp. tritici (strain CRL 75-36-700-3 / race SCCL) TaxID=418459 RepID=H6QQC8_PUCGT|nr:uncharacterized protein PGTG_21089 [Puccinia graminis f. sp. tritici CRL 75-36-700-3]EHS62540.1 hypothetical protein PGTG_21089 [Puccinia graminis f. sp. tritici CRL 75-36-700-3]